MTSKKKKLVIVRGKYLVHSGVYEGHCGVTQGHHGARPDVLVPVAFHEVLDEGVTYAAGAGRLHPPM